jgi:tetratricopeptide (TPR) repeat protein
MMTMRGLRAYSLLACLLLPSVVLAQGQRLEKAKALFSQGKSAYEAGDYDKAYSSFKESYLLSHEPALLYNISSALQGLRRPHDAAEALRSFLRLRPDDPEKPAIEERIRTLEEEQKLVDQEKRNQAPPPPATPPPAQAIVAPPSLSTATPSGGEATLVATRQADEERRKKKIWMGVGISLGILAAGGVALGLALGLSGGTEPYTPATFGPLQGTR